MPVPSPYQFRPLSQGLFHDLLCRIDLIDAGFFGFFQRLSSERQQVALAVLAKAARPLLSLQRTRLPAHHIDADMIALRPVTAAIRRRQPRDLLEQHFGRVPGLLGALNKTNGPQLPVYYDLLVRALRDPEQHAVARVIRQLPELDLHRLVVLLQLDPILLHPPFAAKVHHEEDAKALSAVVGLLQQVLSEAASDAVLRQSVRSVGSRTTVATWVASWLRKIPSIDYPDLTLGDEWTPLDSPKKLSEAGLRLQNCLGRIGYVIDGLQGRTFFYERLGHSTVAEVQAIGPQRFLILAGVHGQGNAFVPRATRKQVERHFHAHGVPTTNWWFEDCPWQSAKVLVGHLRDIEEDDDFDLQHLEEAHIHAEPEIAA